MGLIKEIFHQLKTHLLFFNVENKIMDSQILFYLIKLIVWGIVTFLSIFLMSKQRDSAWMSIICGFLFNYAGVVYSMLVELGILTNGKLSLFGIPVVSLFWLIVPALFFMTGFIIMLVRE